MSAPASDEAYWTEQLIAILRSNLTKDYPDGTRTLRDAHTKAHGCVRAEFIVADDVPPRFRVGIFTTPRTYEAWIRFSSSANSIRADVKRDVMGMAIKVLDAGPPDADGAGAQDFLLTSAVTFMARNLEEFYRFMAAFFAGIPRLALFFLNPAHWRMLIILARVSKKYGSPLTSRYWSMSAYRCGDAVVKYGVRPLQTTPDTPPRGAGPDFLRDAMKAQLAANDAQFEFMLQAQTDPQAMPIDDPSIEWSEQASPFVRVATIRIPPQDFDTAERWDFAENLSFAPWHCLPEHEPLGAINRARKRAYRVLAAYRHDRNHVPPRPPFW
jgi:hypothetical protein